jgi:hypothetical protein
MTQQAFEYKPRQVEKSPFYHRVPYTWHSSDFVSTKTNLDNYKGLIDPDNTYKIWETFLSLSQSHKTMMLYTKFF